MKKYNILHEYRWKKVNQAEQLIFFGAKKPETHIVSENFWFHGRFVVFIMHFQGCSV